MFLALGKSGILEKWPGLRQVEKSACEPQVLILGLGFDCLDWLSCGWMNLLRKPHHSFPCVVSVGMRPGRRMYVAGALHEIP